MVEPAVGDTTPYALTFETPDVAVDGSGQRGFWTMVYDEGFEVQIGGRSFFAFLRFRASKEPRDNAPLAPKDTAGFASECSRTATGWYHAANRTEWGCYYGVQAGGRDGAPLSAQRAAEVETVPERHRVAAPVLASISADLWADGPMGGASFLQRSEDARRANASRHASPTRRRPRPSRRSGRAWPLG